jgi:hypothetical protein
MLKGDLKLPFTMLIAVLGMIGLLFLGLILISGAGTSAKAVIENTKYLNAIDTAHLIEVCLKDGKDFISAEDLDIKSGDIDDICKYMFPGLSDISAKAKVVDLEKKDVGGENKEWDFGYKQESGNPSHNIYINIKYGDEIHIGRLYVQVKY